MTLQRGHDITVADQRGGSIPVISSGGVTSWHDAPMAQAPGVVMGRKGTLGKIFYVADGGYWPHDTTLYVIDFKGNLPRYAYYFLKTVNFASMDVGSANPTLNRNHVHPLPCCWPDLRTQTAIAEVLGALDDKIAANRALIGAVDALCEGLFESLPHSSVAPLKSVAKVNAVARTPADGTIRYLDIASVGVGDYEWPRLMSWADAPGRARRGVAFGDVVWSTVRPNRRSHALILDSDPTLVASTGLAVLTPAGIGPAFLYEASRRPEFTSYLVSVAEGSAYPAVGPERFLDAPIPLVTAEVRDHFEEQAMPIRRRAQTARIENRTLAELRDTLLPELMSGRLRVRDAERAVEQVL